MGFWQTLREDIQVVFERDPAAKSVLEVLLCYPGFHAIQFHRIAHFFYSKKMFLLARVISQISRALTGIEIHPGAKIGRRFFIDHGMGVVIGETTVIGDNVTLYQGVTLGGTGKDKGKRHPTLKDNVIVGVGAKILGNITIGEDCRIGAGAVVVKDVPSDCTVVGVPGRVVIKNGQRIDNSNLLEHGNLPDPLADILTELQANIQYIKDRLKKLEEDKIDVNKSA